MIRGFGSGFVFYGSFIGVTPNKGDLLDARVYFANIIGQLRGYSREISDAKFVSNPYEYKLSDITSKIIASLRQDNYL